MTLNWYPEIDKDQCNNCKKCINLCHNNVFNITNEKIMVDCAEECIWQCTKCQKVCPQNAIYYVLDLDNKISNLELYY